MFEKGMSLCNLNSKPSAVMRWNFFFFLFQMESVWGHVFFFHTHEPLAVLHHLYITQDEKLRRTAELLVSKYLQTSHAPFQLWRLLIIMMKKTNQRHGAMVCLPCVSGFHVPVVISKKIQNFKRGRCCVLYPLLWVPGTVQNKTLYSISWKNIVKPNMQSFAKR